jgi:hypothetical protein
VNTEAVQSSKHKFELCLDTELGKSIPDLKRINYMKLQNIKPFTINDDCVIETNLSLKEMELAIVELSSKSFNEEWSLEDDDYWNSYLDD